jgi:hypothetical protein
MKIYATDKTSLNDPHEELIEPLILEQLSRFKTIFAKMKELNVGFAKVEDASEKAILAFNGVLDKINNIGIYCLARSYKNELLWAHYSDSHKGFCIEYDLNYLVDYYRDKKSINFANILNVKYQRTPPIVDMEYAANNNFDDLIQKLIGTKSFPWRYEQEIRLVFDAIGKQNINLHAIKSITFGARAKDEDIEFTIKSLPFKIKHYKMELNNKYGLNRTKVLLSNNAKELFKYEKPSIDYLIIDDDIDCKQYENHIKQAITKTQQEPFLDSIFYAGLDKESNPGKTLIKINASMNKEISPLGTKSYYYEILKKKIKRVLL